MSRHIQTLLTSEESRRLTALERTIRQGRKVFVSVGLALAEIRDSKLYRCTHRTFEAYCEARWGWSRRYAYNIMEAADTVRQLPENVRNCAQTESQARELARVEPEQRQVVLERAVQRAEAESRPLTAADVREVAVEVVEPEQDPDDDQLHDELLAWWRRGVQRFAAAGLPGVLDIIEADIARMKATGSLAGRRSA